jgi:hypothetical protein
MDTKFDEFDKMNSDSTKMALFNSIDVIILKHLKASLKMNDCFVVAWLTFLDLQLSTSSKHYDDLRRTLREVDARKYAMQNIEDLCLAVDPIIKELDNANQYQPSLTLSFLQRIRSTCTQSLQFPVKIDLKIIDVEKAVKNVSFLTPEEANTQMLSQQLDPESILKFLKDAYYTLKKDNLWEPANRPTDTGTVLPSALVNLDASGNIDGKLTSALKVLLQFDQSAFADKNSGEGKKTPQTSPCNICGKLGHWAPKCPDKDKSSSSATVVTSNRSSNRDSEKGSWKRQPPGPNEPQTKKVKHRTFFWCDKCKRWSTSHGTEQHTKKDAANPAPSASLAIDPSVWLASTNLDQQSDDVYPSFSGQGALAFVGFTIGLFIFVQVLLKLMNLTYNTKMLFTLLGTFHSLFVFSQKLINEAVIMRANSFYLSTSPTYLDLQSTLSLSSQFVGSLMISASTAMLDIGSEIMSQVSQLHWTTFVAPILWISTLLLLVFDQPTKVGTRHAQHAKKGKVQRKKRRPYELFFRRTMKKIGSRIQRWWLNDKVVPQVKGRRYFKHKHRRITNATRRQISISHRDRRHRKCFEHEILNYVTRSQAGVSPRRLHQEYHRHRRMRRQGRGVNQVVAPNVLSATSSQLRALTSPMYSALRCLLSSSGKSSEFPIIWDTGASVCTTSDRNDFISFSSEVGNIVSAQSLCGLTKTSTVKVQGEGYVVWYIKDTTGVYRALKVPCAYVPEAQIRLFSTSVLASHFPNEEFILRGEEAYLSGVPNDVLRGRIAIKMDPKSQLFISQG